MFERDFRVGDLVDYDRGYLDQFAEMMANEFFGQNVQGFKDRITRVTDVMRSHYFLTTQSELRKLREEYCVCERHELYPGKMQAMGLAWSRVLDSKVRGKSIGRIIEDEFPKLMDTVYLCNIWLSDNLRGGGTGGEVLHHFSGEIDRWYKREYGVNPNFFYITSEDNNSMINPGIVFNGVREWGCLRIPDNSTIQNMKFTKYGGYAYRDAAPGNEDCELVYDTKGNLVSVVLHECYEEDGVRLGGSQAFVNCIDLEMGSYLSDVLTSAQYKNIFCPKDLVDIAEDIGWEQRAGLVMQGGHFVKSDYYSSRALEAGIVA